MMTTVRHWLTENPRITVHFTPTSASWMNLVEIWFGIIERQAIHRGTFHSGGDLTSAIKTFVDGWNPRASVGMDQDCRRNRQESQTANNFKRGPLGWAEWLEAVSHDPCQSVERAPR
jgi:hypothetical protein